MAIVINGDTGITATDASEVFGETLTIDGLTVGQGAGNVSTNTAVGVSALAANTTGSNSTAVGYQAGYSNTTGTITSFGYRAGYSNTTGTNNVAIGGVVSGTNWTLAGNTTGNYNVAVGDAALGDNTTGSSNTAVGTLALENNTTANNNTAVGYQAGYSATTANGNSTYIGFSAGANVTSGYSNTFVGSRSGTTGNGAGQLVTTGSNNTILGAYNGNQGGLDIRTSSNNIVLSDGDGNPRMRADSNGQFYSLITGVGLYADYGCRAWVNFNGSGTVAIRASGNVSSITDNGTGNYTVNFSTALPDGNYAVGASFQRVSSSGDMVNIGFSNGIGSFNVETFSGGATSDMNTISLVVLR